MISEHFIPDFNMLFHTINMIFCRTVVLNFDKVQLYFSFDGSCFRYQVLKNFS